jgi:SAM-dependent methyltransferase
VNAVAAFARRGPRADVAGPLCARFHAATAPRAGPDEVAWYRARLPRDAGAALDLMCGYGRLLVPLAEAGGSVHGVDISPAMLQECEARLAAAKVAAPLFRQDVAELNVPFRYAAAFIGSGAIRALRDVTRTGAALARVRAHLVPPGLLVIDVRVPAASAQRIAAPLVEVQSVTLDDGSRIALRSETTMHPDAQTAHVASRYVHRRGNALVAEESAAGVANWYTPDELAGLLKDAGFDAVAIGPAVVPDDGGTAFSVVARAG